MKNIYKFFVITSLTIAFGVSCKKTPLDHASKMAGTRYWHGTMLFPNGSGSDDTAFLIDTLTIIVINNSTIAINSNSYGYRFYSGHYDTLHHEAYHDSTNVISYGYGYSPSYGDYTTIGISYNYVTNAIIYNGIWSSYQGSVGDTYITLNTP